MTQTQISAAGARAGGPAAPRSPGLPLRTRLHIALAGLWLLDGLLQLQPYMFTKSFAVDTIYPTAQGSPAWIASPVMWSARLILNHAIAANTVFALAQVAIGLGIAYRPTRKPALACSAVWAAFVWYFGESLGMVFSGSGNPLTGAPGSASLYMLAAILLWPTARTGEFPAAGRFGARAARIVWSVLWLSLAYLSLQPAVRAPGTFAGAVTGMMGEPPWYAGFVGHIANMTSGHDLAIATVLALIEAFIGLSVWAPRRSWVQAGLGAAIVLGLVYWVVGQAFGMPFMGMATDPNSGPLMVLLAVAYWPARAASIPRQRGNEDDADAEGAVA